MATCALEGCENPTKPGRKYCCPEHYYQWLRAGNAPHYWQDKKRPGVGEKIAKKLKGRTNTALLGRKFPDRKNDGQFKKGTEPWNKGQEMTKEYGQRVRQAMIEKGAIRRGPDNSSWKGGVTPETQKLRHSEEYVIWRTAVFERDAYTCRTCGQIGGMLVAHHIKKWENYLELRLVVENGLTMCRACHTRLHTSGSGYDDTGEPDEIVAIICNHNGSM